jgi:hypothetical protein
MPRKRRRRRRHIDRHSVAVVVSYVPLLVDRPSSWTKPDDPRFTSILKKMDECPSGHVDGCLWVTEGQHAVPVFIVERAREIAGHLQMWSEGKPGDWFRLCFAESRGRYTAVLFPDLDRSVRRFQETYQILTGKTVKADEYRVMHIPLGFVSGSKHIFDQVRSRIAEPTMLGFIDTSEVNPSDPLTTNLKDIEMVGPFQVCWDQKPFGTNISSLVEERIREAEFDESDTDYC